jgi:hypothetical protein
MHANADKFYGNHFNMRYIGWTWTLPKIPTMSPNS